MKKENALKKITGIVWAIVIMATFTSATIISDTTSTFSDDITINGDIAVSGTVDGVYIADLNTIVGGVTAAEMDQVEAIGANVITAAIWARLAGLDQAVGTTGTPTFVTVDTGQGANELYDMNQNVQTTSNVTFNKQIIQPAQATTALTIDQNNAASSLVIDSEATTGYGVDIDVSGSTSSYGLRAYHDSNNNYVRLLQSDAVTNAQHYFYRNLAAASTSSAVVGITQDNAGDDQVAFRIINDGTGQGMFIDQNGDRPAIEIDAEGITQPGVYISLPVGASPTIQIEGTESGGCSVGDYGFYTTGGDIYWCKNGVGTKLN